MPLSLNCASTTSQHHPSGIDPASVKLANAQLARARSYGLPYWPRLVVACCMTDAIWRGDAGTVREPMNKEPPFFMFAAHPALKRQATLRCPSKESRSRTLGSPDLAPAHRN